MQNSKTKRLMIGGVPLGGGADISVQSMTNTDTRDVEATVSQILRLEAAGCDIVRLAVPDMEAVRALFKIKGRTSRPVVADIHFDYRLAVEAAAAGADKIRINPGNIGGDDRVHAVANACKAENIPIRVGANSGSVSKELLAKFGGPTPEALAESALLNIALLNRFDFDDICVSLKSSGVRDTVEANRIFSARDRHPLHIGVTEAGLMSDGVVKSAIGMGALLIDGIGDTLRVSLTADPVEEVRAGISILKALELRKGGVEIISCPTCGRCRVDLIGIAERVHRELANVKTPLKIAVMGCAVNGPGEAREADLGIACGDDSGLLFKKGEIFKSVPIDQLVEELVKLAIEREKNL